MPFDVRMTRRRALAMLGASAGAGAGAVLGRESAAMAWLGHRDPHRDAPIFPRGAVIRTLLKDMPPDALSGGPVLFHEHLSMRYPPQAKEHFTDDVAMMIEEARAARTGGIACIVDGGHPDMSRNLDALKRIATESGL